MKGDSDETISAANMRELLAVLGGVAGSNSAKPVGLDTDAIAGALDRVGHPGTAAPPMPKAGMDGPAAGDDLKIRD